jgi:WD40 repeat protein
MKSKNLIINIDRRDFYLTLSKCKNVTDVPLSHKGLNGEVSGVAFSPDGKILASANAWSTVSLWDVDKHEPLCEPLKGHQNRVTCVAFSPDGNILVSASWDKTLILWDVGQRKPIGPPLQGHQDQVNYVAFSPDGKILASASDDFTVTLWDVELEPWVRRACRAANRNLSRKEWAEIVGTEVDYEPACQDLPVPGD